MQWKNVYVFISSTFNDMHAERDHLVKRVFPELRRWCASRKLKLMDIDLRWGVSEADAQENKRVVEVCMHNIDRCRPFFLCFLGQRRGWIPGPSDVSPATLEAFPALQKYLGKTSVTELEILHALLNPLDGKSTPVEHARFYFRDNGYLKSLGSAHMQLFAPKRGFLSGTDRDLEQFKKNLSKQFPTVTYTAQWNPSLPSPELTGAFATGRLEDFRIGDTTLEADVLQWLQQEIAAQFPEHMAINPAEGSLEQELERQDTQLFQAYDGYISRPAEEQAMAVLLDAPDHRPVLLVAQAGCGKTSLLAHLIHVYRGKRKVYYRLIGTTPHSFHLDKLSSSLVHQWITDGLLSEKESSYTDEEMALAFPNLLTEAAAKEPFLLILDGMDQLLGKTDWQQWLPKQLPEGCDVVVSLRQDADHFPEGLRLHRLGLMEARTDKVQMVRSYMRSFLKDVDDSQLEHILNMQGSSNPLFMKIVLNELRQHGSFDTLLQMLLRDYGSTPLDAFRQVLERVTGELVQQGYPNDVNVVLFGCLACAQSGMDGTMLAEAAACVKGWEDIPRQQIIDTVYALARELEPFLVLDGDRISIRYDSLRRAILSEMVPLVIQYIHVMLCVAFSGRACREDSAEDLVMAAYHVCHASEDFIANFFRTVPMLMRCIKKCGTGLLADTCRELVQARGLQDYAELGRVLDMVGVRVDTCPDTLFMELRRYADLQNPAIQSILEQESAQAALQYFQPLKPAGIGSMAQQEYGLNDPDIQGVEYTAGYLLICTKKLLKVVDQHTQKTVNILYFSAPEDGSYTKRHITTGDGLVYLSEWDMNSTLKGWKCYNVPDLERIDQGGVTTDYHTLDHLQVVDGRLYGLFQHHLRYDKPNPGKGVISRLVNLHTGDVTYCHRSQGNCHALFRSPVAIFRDEETGIFTVIRANDGKELTSDKFVGKCDAATSGLLDGTANLYAVCGSHLYIWLSGCLVKDRALQHLTELRKYAFAPDGTLALVQRTSPELQTSAVFGSIHCSNLQLLGDRYLITESSGRVSFLDTQLQALGHLDLENTITATEEWSGRFLLSGDDEMMVFHPKKLQYYRLSQLLAVLTDTSRDASHVALETCIHQGKFYVFDTYLERTNLRTLETEQEKPEYRQYAMTYTPWNLLHTQLLAGTGYMSGIFTLKHVTDMRLWLQRRVADNDSKLLHAFTYLDDREDYCAGVVMADTKTVKRKYLGKEETFQRCHLRTQGVHKLATHVAWQHTDLQIEIAHQGLLPVLPQFIAGPTYGYLVFPNVYVDENTVALKIYDLKAQQFVYTRPLQFQYGWIFARDFVFDHNGFVLSVRTKEDVEQLHFHSGERKVYIDHIAGTLIHTAPVRNTVFFHDNRNKLLLCYDFAQHKVVREISLSDRKYLQIQQVLLLDNWLLLRDLNSDILEVYDFDTGKKLFDQRMEMQVEHLEADNETGTLCMLDTAQRTAFWKKTASHR